MDSSIGLDRVMRRCGAKRVADGSIVAQVVVMLDLMPTHLPPELLQSLIETSPHAIVIFDQDHLVKCWSPMAEAIFETPCGDAIGVSVLDLLSVESSGTATNRPMRFAEMQVARESRNAIQIEQVCHQINLNGQAWTIVYLSDVTVRREHERRLATEALTDPLSGLANRRGFQDQLETALSGKLTLAIIDADHFKQINDQFGHEAGDLAIQYVAQQLRLSFPDSVCCARLGGDEFGVVLATGSLADTEANFEKLRQRITGYQLSGYEFSLTVSIGVALSNIPGTSARELLTTADRCMYQAKEAGRNRIVIQPINV